MKNGLRYLVLFPGEFSFYVHFTTSSIVRHRVRKIVLMQTETIIFVISKPIDR